MCVSCLCFSLEENVYGVPSLILIKSLLNPKMILLLFENGIGPCLPFIYKKKQKPENDLTEMICCFDLQPWTGMAFSGLYVCLAMGISHFYG